MVAGAPRSGSTSPVAGPARVSARALALSCHPVPTLAVTGLGAGLAALAALPPARLVLVTLAVLAGQLSIGWGNDYLDADRDRATGRADKPVAAGALPPRAVGVAAAVATVAAVLLSILLGLPGAVAALTVVACGWAYNAGVKGTVLSWLPYAVAFGALPAVATLSADPARRPPGWAVAAGALLGVAAHLANVLPDLAADDATGVRGLPHRLGARATAVGGAVALLAASVVLVIGPPGGPGVVAWLGVGGAAALGCGAAASAWRDPTGRGYFLAVVAVALLDVGLFVIAGQRLG